MPWSEKQSKVLRAIEHGWKPSNGAFSGVSKRKAGEMADEGIKRSVSKARRRHSVGRKMRG